jgi:hypothetical protein
MFRDGHTHDPPAIMCEEHQDEEESARGRRDHEEVGRNQLLRMVRQERTPRLRGPWPTANHVGGDGCLRNGVSQFQELTVNPRRTQRGFAADIVRIRVRTS